MPSFLSFVRRHAAFVIVLAIALGAFGIILLSTVSFDANILRLLPRHSDSVRAFQDFLEDFGSLDHLFIEFDSDGPIGEHQELVDAYVDELRKAPEVLSVDAQLFEAGKDWNYLADRELYLLGGAGAAEALSRFAPPRMDREISHARDLLSMPSAQIKELVRQDPLGLLTILRGQIGKEKGFVSFDPTQEGYVSQDGRSRLVIVKPKGQPFDSDFCKALFRRLSDVESKVRQAMSRDDSSAAAVRIQAAGAYRVSIEAEQLIRHEGIVNSLGSLALLLLIMFGVFRTPWVLLCGFLPLAIAAVLTLGINGRLQGSLSPATSGSAGMLFGIGIDGVVILYLRFLEERRAGASTDEAVSRMGGSAVSVVLAQMTTVATFFALLFIDFPSLQDLGGLVGVGMLLCCGLTLVLLPALLPARREVRLVAGHTAPWLGRFVTRSARSIVWVSLILTMALGLASTRLRIDTSIEKLQARTEGSLLEREVAARFSLPQDVLLVLDDRADIETLLETETRLERAVAEHMPSVTAGGIGFMLPSAREQTGVARAIIESGRNETNVREDMMAAARRAGFKPDTFDPFLRRVGTLLDPNARISYDDLMAHGLESVLSRFVVRHDGRYRGVTYLYPRTAVDVEALRRIVHDLDPQLRLTGLPVINHDMRRQFFPQFMKGITIGFAAVALLIYIVFRTVRHTLLALLPTGVGFIWSAGLLALAGVELDLFSMFAVVTFIGIVVDYGIYLLYRLTRERTLDVNGVLTTTGPAIIIACAMALIGFGTLVNSSYVPLHVFGLVSVVALTCCLAASIVSLPAFIVEMERWSSRR